MLAHTIFAASNAKPQRLLLFLHGILGRRSNFQSIAKDFVERRPDWGAATVDLRMHGGSQHLNPPHTLERAAQDLIELERELPLPVHAVAGHSFGGKVALIFAELREHPLAHACLIDSLPGNRLSARAPLESVLTLLSQMPNEFRTRGDFVARAIRDGYDEPIAHWLAMNLRRTDTNRLVIQLDLDAIRALVDDYFAQDLWPAFETPPPGVHLHALIAGRSTVYDESDRARAEGARGERVSVDVLPDSDHWIHVDAPGALLDWLDRSLRP